MLLLAITFIGDLLWMLYWVPFWWDPEAAKYQLGLHSFVILCSFVNWIMKLAVLIMLGLTKQADLNNAIGRLRNQGK